MSGRLLDVLFRSPLTGVGAAQSSKLAKIGPAYRAGPPAPPPFQCYGAIVPILLPYYALPSGIYATVEGEVLNCNITFGGRRMMTARLAYGLHSTMPL